MPHRLIATYAPDYMIAIVGVFGSLFAQVVDGSNAIPTTITMGSVVAILLWMQSKRDEVSAKREEALMSRVSKLEDDAHSKLMAIIERQLQSQVRTEDVQSDMRQSSEQMRAGLGEVQRLLQRMINERPCLLAERTLAEGAE